MKLNKIFASHMVFARRLPIRVYGEGRGTVEICFAGQKKTLLSEDDCWAVEFPPMEYGGPYSMTVTLDGDSILLEDIYVGEVILISGQSNMQFKLNESNTPSEMYTSHDKFRMFFTDRLENNERYTSDDGWMLCEREKIGNWSAIGYLTANEILKHRDIAIGMIACYQGASVIESWVPAGTFESIGIDIPLEEKFLDHTHELFGTWNGDGQLYSYALSQVVPYPVSSVVWYQGESDASEAEGRVYAEELAAMIRVWRRDFGNETLPFVIVQIADNIDRAGIGWSLIQQAQIDVQSLLPYVRTVISADVCENDDIHPKTKTKLAQRVSEVLLKDMDC